MPDEQKAPEQTTPTDATTSQTTPTQPTPEAQEEMNKTKALEIERKARKDLQAKLDEYAKRDTEQEEKEKMKKGKYEELIAEKSIKLAEYEAQISELATYKEKFEVTMQKQIDELSFKIPEGKKAFIEKLISGKTHDEKVEILQEFSKEFTTYSPNAPKGVAKIPPSYTLPNGKKDISAMIASAPVL